MTGTGTQADPYVVSNWDELVTAAAQAEAYVTLPSNATWNMDAQYPSGAPDIVLWCAEINGNGAVIHNLRKSGGTLFNRSLNASGETLIKNLGIGNAYFSDSAFSICEGSVVHPSLKFEGLVMGGEFYNSML